MISLSFPFPIVPKQEKRNKHLSGRFLRRILTTQTLKKPRLGVNRLTAPQAVFKFNLIALLPSV